MLSGEQYCLKREVQKHRSSVVVPSCWQRKAREQPQLGAQGGGFRPTQLLGLHQEVPIFLGSPRQWGFW